MNSLAKLIGIIVISVVIIVLSIYWYSKDYIPKYRWDETYNYQSDQPYGLKLLFDLLSQTQTKDNFEVLQSSPRHIFKGQDTSSMYILVGNRIFMDASDSELLMDFVRRGNTAFISTISSEHSVFSTLTNDALPYIDLESYSDSLVKTTVTHEQKDTSLKFDYKYGDKLIEYGWLGIDSVTFADSLSAYQLQRVSHLNGGLVECFRVKCGKGWFIFQFNPVLFTNYNLSKKQGLSYANAVMSGYPKRKIYWDEYSKMFRMGKIDSQESPLRFILSERSLRWAWYLLCFFVLIFIIFNAKRKQAVIPLLPDNKNTTVEYIRAIATLHYQNNSLDYLAEERLKQFLSFVKHRYGISPNLDKQEIVQLLAPRSGISEDILKELFKCYLDIRYIPEVKDMLEFYRLTEYFYQNCK